MTERKWAFEVPGKLEIPYRYFAGTFCSQWFRALRDKSLILGCRCPKCRKVFVPPRGNCERCLAKIEEWVPLTGTGTVESWTVVRYSEPFQPARPPFILAAIKLDGADTCLVHLVAGVAPDRMQAGLRVEPVFAKERKGRITDIAHFRPLAKEKRAAYQKPVVKKTKARPKTQAKPKTAQKAAGKKVAKDKAAAKRVSGKKAAKAKAVRKKPAQKTVRRTKKKKKQ